MVTIMHQWFNPKRFMRIAWSLFPWILALTIGVFCYGLYQALIVSPEDYQQGAAVRMMYVHVPAAWMAMGVYGVIASCALARFVWKNPFADILTISAAPIGAAFTLMCLITGSFWGKPIWGAWWVWDARLTSMLLLLFIYVAYMALYGAFDDLERAGKISGLFALFGAINLPIIKFSVEWWNTLHQPASIMRSGGVAIDPQMLTPLLLMFGAYIGWFLLLWILRIQSQIWARKIRKSQIMP